MILRFPHKPDSGSSFRIKPYALFWLSHLFLVDGRHPTRGSGFMRIPHKAEQAQVKASRPDF